MPVPCTRLRRAGGTKANSRSVTAVRKADAGNRRFQKKHAGRPGRGRERRGEYGGRHGLHGLHGRDGRVGMAHRRGLAVVFEGADAGRQTAANSGADEDKRGFLYTPPSRAPVRGASRGEMGSGGYLHPLCGLRSPTGYSFSCLRHADGESDCFVAELTHRGMADAFILKT